MGVSRKAMAGLVQQWSRSLNKLVMAAADFADTGEWMADGSPTPAAWLANAAGVEASTARDWIRVGRCLRTLHASAAAFKAGDLSYTKVRALTRFATPDNEAELLELAKAHPASELNRLLAAWLTGNSDPEELEAHQHGSRSMTSRVEPDGMTTFTIKLPPLQAGVVSAHINRRVMTTRPAAEPDGSWPTLAQQSADALASLLTDQRHGGIATEVIVHVRADGNTLDDGTPIPDTVVERIAPTSFIRALIHDTDSRPIDATNRRRHPTTRQKRVVSERCGHQCVDCGRRQLLEYDHTPPYEQTGHTSTAELTLRCAPCHQRTTAARSEQRRVGATPG